jgi:hypothetical protein
LISNKSAKVVTTTWSLSPSAITSPILYIF